MEIWYKAEDGQFFRDMQKCDAHEKQLKRQHRRNLMLETARLDDEIWRSFYPESLSMVSDVPGSEKWSVWLKADIKAILADVTLPDGFDEKLSRIKEILSKSSYSEEILSHYVDLDEIVKHSKISLDLDQALTDVKHGDELSSALNYGLSPREFEQLVNLHEAGKHQKKIEELLTDLNFHYECGLLIHKEYDKLREEKNKEQERD